MYVLNQETIEIDLQQSIDHAQAQVDSLTACVESSEKEYAVVDKAVARAGDVAMGVMDAGTPDLHIQMLVSILSLSSCYGSVIRNMIAHNIRQYSLSLEFQKGQLDMLTQMKAQILANRQAEKTTELPVQ